MELKVRAHAKINLTLDVLEKRTDGYHEVKMVMQTIDLSDKLFFKPQPGGINLETNHPKLPTGKKNLIYQAAELLFTEFDLESGLQIRLDKKIPVAAGLAGGSTDAAATLIAVNKLWKLGLTDQQLVKRAAKLGSDIPFCLQGGTQLATGRGTNLTTLSSGPTLNLVVVNPPFAVSTAEVYNNFSYYNRQDLLTDELLAYLRSNQEEVSKEAIINRTGNMLAKSTLELYPEVNNLQERVKSKTDKVLVAGSGPTVLGFVKTKHQAKQVAVDLKEELGPNYRVLAAQTTNKGIELN
jgi:4-diphosphocytidyl-2-C-methyl-D-erythritol kinase